MHLSGPSHGGARLSAETTVADVEAWCRTTIARLVAGGRIGPVADAIATLAILDLDVGYDKQDLHFQIIPRVEPNRGEIQFGRTFWFDDEDEPLTIGLAVEFVVETEGVAVKPTSIIGVHTGETYGGLQSAVDWDTLYREAKKQVEYYGRHGRLIGRPVGYDV